MQYFTAIWVVGITCLIGSVVIPWLNIPSFFCYETDRFTAIVDAGSSGSRLLVYERDRECSNISQICIISIEPGMNSFVGDSDGFKRNINELLSGVSDCLRQHEVFEHNIPLFFYATGGVRKLPHPQQKMLFDSIVDSFPYFHLKTKSILDGEDEAKFGLYAANYLSGTFSVISYNSDKTVGSCDLGGESFEIGYFLSNSSQPVAKSYGALGANNVMNQILRYLLRMQGDIVENPCYPLDYSEIHGNRIVWGTAKFDECDALVHQVFLNCSKSFGFDSLAVPQTSRVFYAMSLLFYVADYFSFVVESGTANEKVYNATELRLLMRSVNLLSWKQLVNEIGNEHRYTSYQLLPYRMMQGFWIQEILSKISYGSSANKILFVKTIGGKNVEWSLGAALYLFFVFL